MIKIYGFCLIIALFFYSIIMFKRESIFFLFNYARLGFFVWTLGLGLYNLKLSNLYTPDLMVNFIGTIVIINFILLNIFLPIKSRTIIRIFDNIKLPKEGFLFSLYFTFFLGVLSFVKNLNAGLLRFFISNKGIRADISLSYFFHSLVVVSICFYILGREEKKIYKKIWYFILFLISSFLEFTNLARGPLVFIGIGILFYELYKYIIKRKTIKFKIKQIVLIIILAFIAVWAFGAIGDSRTKNMFGTTATNYYKMTKNFPSGFTWIYIYLTSPLENLRYSLSNCIIDNYSFFNQLLYPIIKFIANLIGRGDAYREFVNSFDSMNPYLWDLVGLNMSTFITSAFLDAGFLGLFIYLIAYDLIAYFLNKIIVSKNINSISKIIIIPLILQIPVWSIFTNSILGVTSIWSDLFFILFWNFSNYFVIRKKNIFKKEVSDYGKVFN